MQKSALQFQKFLLLLVVVTCMQRHSSAPCYFCSHDENDVGLMMTRLNFNATMPNFRQVNTARNLLKDSGHFFGHCPNTAFRNTGPSSGYHLTS
jgi:hypothetical protein